MPKCPQCTNEYEPGLSQCPFCGRAVGVGGGVPLDAPPLDESTADEVRRLLSAGQRIQAVALVRQVTGVGLAQAMVLTAWVADTPQAEANKAMQVLDPGTTAAVRRLLDAGQTDEAGLVIEQATGLDADAAGRMATAMAAGSDAVHTSTARVTLDAALTDEVRQLLVAGQRLAAIKLLHERAGLGLAEAKAVADHLVPPAAGLPVVNRPASVLAVLIAFMLASGIAFYVLFGAAHR